jgi:hypothetical protein
MRRRKFKSNLSSKKFQSKFNSSRFNSSKSSLILYNGMPVRPFVSTSVRSFDSTSSKRVDPLGFTALSYATPYSPSLLANPIAGAFILLTGMAVTLYFLTSALPQFFEENPSPSYAEIICKLDNICLLAEKFIVYRQSGIDIIYANINNFTPETITNLYFSLQELVTAGESLFDKYSYIIDLPEIEFIGGPLKDRIHEIHEDLRLGGNNLMGLIRDMEDILNLPQEERIPTFWFEA